MGKLLQYFLESFLVKKSNSISRENVCGDCKYFFLEIIFVQVSLEKLAVCQQNV